MNCCICNACFDDDMKKYNFVPSDDSYKICQNCFTRISYLQEFGGDKKNNISDKAFEFIINKKGSISDMTVRERINEILQFYSDEETYNKLQQEKQEKQEKDRADYQKDLEKEHKKMFKSETFKSVNILVSTTPILDGYEIEKYVDIVNSEYVIGTGVFSEWGAYFSDLFGTAASGYQGKLSMAKNMALHILKLKANQLKCNAVVGIDIDISTIGNNMIMVSANGTAVNVKKIENIPSTLTTPQAAIASK